MSETIEDIVREMREFADTDSQTIGRDVLRRKIQHFADSIEAAHEFWSVVDKARAAGEGYAACVQSVADCNQLKDVPTTEKSSQVGNAAKCKRDNDKPMTLDEAIAHAEEFVARTRRRRGIISSIPRLACAPPQNAAVILRA